MAASGHGSEWVRLGDGSLITEDAKVGLGHMVSVETYTMTLLTLLALTFITVFAATIDFGALSLTVALLIATVKAGIVTLIFMHLNFESKIIWGIVIYPLFIFALLLAGTLGDYSVKDKPSPISGKTLEVPAETLPPVGHSSTSGSSDDAEASTTGH
jgi:caa(3)-type oxidase subunit IV